jgi:hydrogenase expression/formation protein HypD
MRALLASGETRIDGIVCPGHVSVVIGTRPYEFIPAEFGVGCAVSGFEPLDILRAIDVLVQQVESGTPAVVNAYPRAVSEAGNPTALSLIQDVFLPCDASWRGIGAVAGSGLVLRPEFADFDASDLLDLEVEEIVEPAGCRCGDVLRGCLTPPQCALYGGVCTPEHPVGPCMVSQEGACAAHYAYGAEP